MEKLEELGYTIPTLEVNCKYKYHITSGDIITIEPKITEFNGVRMTVTYNVIDKKTEKIVINAWTKHCFTDKTLRPINIKKKNEKIYTIFEKLFGQEITGNDFVVGDESFADLSDIEKYLKKKNIV